MVDNFSQGWSFKSLNRDGEISSRILSDDSNRITTEQSEMNFSLHVNELKIIM